MPKLALRSLHIYSQLSIMLRYHCAVDLPVTPRELWCRFREQPLTHGLDADCSKTTAHKLVNRFEDYIVHQVFKCT